MTDPALYATLARIEAKLDALSGGASKAQSKAVLPVADDYDLDGQYGNEEIRFEPKQWTGESFLGKQMSDCTVEYLEELARMFDSWGDRDQSSNAVDAKGRPREYYKRKSASRARGWAARKRNAETRPGKHTNDLLPF